MARKTIRARRLGKQIGKLRDAAKLGQDALAELVSDGQPRGRSISQGQLSKVEGGSARLTVEQLEQLIAVLRLEPATATNLERLRARADEPGWWNEYRELIPEALEHLIELGADASTIRTYDGVFVNGLLQTADYARAVIESCKAFVRPIDVDTMVELRMRRQRRLTEPDFGQLTAVMTESTLRQLVGGRDVMRAQLQATCEIMEAGVAAVHLLPFDRAPWPGHLAFTIFEFPDEGDGEIVHVDGDLGAGMREDRESIKSLTYTFHMSLGAALTARESLDFCHAVIKEL